MPKSLSNKKFKNTNTLFVNGDFFQDLFHILTFQHLSKIFFSKFDKIPGLFIQKSNSRTFSSPEVSGPCKHDKNPIMFRLHNSPE